MHARGTLAGGLLTLLLLLPEGAAQSLALTINPVMVKGPADVPVTIVEFSDYQ